MNKEQIVLIFALLSFFPKSVFADDDPYIQYLPEYMPQAPNSQAIARAIDIPVNYYTGTPNISIPLYDIQIGNVSIPISLSYQGGGIRPSQEATSVGLGWNLNAGGAITRTVKCADDFMEHYVPNSQFVYGFFDKQDWPDYSIPFDYNYYRKVGHFDGLNHIFKSYLCADSEPDIFFYSIPCCSGKFSFKKDRSIVNYNENNHVEISHARGSNYFYVIDAQGTSYWFETKERTYVYSGGTCQNINTIPGGVDMTAFGPNDHLTEVSDYTSTWFLTKIVSATNDTIDFEYDDESFMLPLQENCRYIRRIEGDAHYQDGDGPEYSHTKTQVESKRLTRINWRGGHVKFEYDKDREDLVGDAKALTSIKVYSAENLLVSHWKMSYTYFNKNQTGIANNRKHLFKRLCLTSVKDKLTEQDPYQFGYYDEVPLPLKNTKNLDYWGYYNGVSQGNTYYCPSSRNIMKSYKSADDHYSKVGILESIQHPTGGTTRLHWECNKIGENIITGSQVRDGNHDSFTRGYLQAHRGGTSAYEGERAKAVLLTEETEIYLLLTTQSSGSQPPVSPSGTPFTIAKVNDNGTKTVCNAWGAGLINDESEHTVTLAPGIYEFKCTAVADSMEYGMFFTDSRNKYNTRKGNDDFIFCYRGTEVSGMPETATKTIVLNHGEIIFLSCFGEPFGETGNVDFSTVRPFSIYRKNENGTYEELSTWTIQAVNADEFMTLHLEAGTYRLQCDAAIDNIAFGMQIRYGEVQYSPIDINKLDNFWNTSVLLAYREANVGIDEDLEEEESDTIVLTSPARLYFDWFCEDKTGSISTQQLAYTYPFSIYKKLQSGTFEKIFSIPANFFADYDDLGQEASGLYLPAGTYLVKCEATAQDVVFCSIMSYREDGIYSNNGANCGGLRIARIEGDKNVTFLYEGGKELIPPCTYYKEKRRYEYESREEEVTYAVQPSESVRPLSTLKNGNAVGYSRVVQVQSDKSRTEYTYYNEEEVLEDPDFPYSPSLTDWQNGLMLTQTVFTPVGDTLSHTSNAYTLKLVHQLYKVGFMEIRPGYNVDYFNKVECPLLSNTMTTEYRNNGKYTVRQKYQYNENLMCTEETKTIGPDVHKTIYKYANDFTDNVSQLMVLTNRIGVPVAKLSMRNGVFYNGTRTVFGLFGQLADNGNTVVSGTRPAYGATYSEMYLPQTLKTLNTSNAASTFSSCQFDTTIVFNSYTRYGKARDLVYKGMPISYVWSYNSLYPVAEVKNATYQQFCSHYGGGYLDRTNYIYEDPEFIRDKIWSAANSLNNAAVKICLYKPLVGVTSITENSGLTHTYDYDQAGRLIAVNRLYDMSSSHECLQSYTYAKNMVNTLEYPTGYSQSRISSIQYYDPWGRPSLLAAQGMQQNGSYSYSMQTYDQLGHPSMSYVPVPSSSQTGGLIDSTQFVSMSANAFSGDLFGYSMTQYDALGRNVVTTTPGEAWYSQGKSTTTQYLTNLTNEVKRYGVSGNSLTSQGYYPAGTLDCTAVTDPDGQILKTYKDVFGNVVLERRANGYDTYYVYDNLNRLRFVLPPKYQDENNLGYYAYRYEYDGRGRMTKKQLPGCSPVQYWYDGRDRLIRMQDGVLAQTGSFRVWTYDALDRQVAQSIQQTGGSSQDEMRWYYDNYSFTSSYAWLLPSGVTGLLPSPAYTGKGRLTGTWQRASNGEPLLAILGYSSLGFLSKKTEVGLGRQLSVTDYENNLAGMVTNEQFRKFARNSSGSVQCLASGTIQNNYDYLHTKLLTSSVITITDKNGSMRIDTIQHLTYDNFGHVMTNDRGGTVADMTYGYDQMHGWLKSIKSSGKFEQKLYREMEGSTPCYNGNISAMTWKTGNDYVRRFDYRYNAMNWLSHADFSYYQIGNPSSPSPTLSLIPYVGMDHEDYSSEYYYDKNGNLTGAYRQGLVGDLYDEDEYSVYDTMDDYNVEYNGNQRRSVNGTGVGSPSYYGSSSFVDGIEDGDNEYAYNGNGAMTKDLNKGITNISYDQLNNIREVTFSGNRSILYTYAADGTRLRTVHSRKVGNTWLKDSTDYCGSLILQNGVPGMYHFTGGYISFSNSALSGCHYYIQDYLGNNRMVVNKTGAVEQTTHYYPYGGIIGGIDQNPSFQKYKFGGKELDRSYGLDWYDVLARQYDPVVPSWHTVDPLAKKYYWISPYVYCTNNPVNAVDPDGKEKKNVFPNQNGQAEIAQKAIVDNFQDSPNTIVIFGHGDSNGIHIYGDNGDMIVNSVGRFVEYLDKESVVWQTRYVTGAKISIALYSCETGKSSEGHPSIAQQISKELKGVSVYAPNDDLSIKGDGQTMVYNNNSWVEYRDNQQVRRYDADQQPGSVSFDMKYGKWGKSELINKDKMVPWK